MQVNPTGNSSPIRLAHTAAPVIRERGNTASFTRLDRLAESVRSMSVADVREAEVARARAIAEKPPYPPAETVRRIANLLAIHFERPPE